MYRILNYVLYLVWLWSNECGAKHKRKIVERHLVVMLILHNSSEKKNVVKYNMYSVCTVHQVKCTVCIVLCTLYLKQLT